MSLFTLYLITTLLPNLQGAACGLCTITGMILISISVGYFMFADLEKEKKAFNKCLKIILPIFVISGVVSIAIPNQQQLYVIAGGSFATNIEGADKLPANIIKAANDFLEGVNKEPKK